MFRPINDMIDVVEVDAALDYFRSHKDHSDLFKSVVIGQLEGKRTELIGSDNDYRKAIDNIVNICQDMGDALRNG